MQLSTYYYGRHVARLPRRRGRGRGRRRRRRRSAFAPTINTPSHDNLEKISSWVSFPFLYEFGARIDKKKVRFFLINQNNCNSIHNH